MSYRTSPGGGRLRGVGGAVLRGWPLQGRGEGLIFRRGYRDKEGGGGSTPAPAAPGASAILHPRGFMLAWFSRPLSRNHGPPPPSPAPLYHPLERVERGSCAGCDFFRGWGVWFWTLLGFGFRWVSGLLRKIAGFWSSF